MNSSSIFIALFAFVCQYVGHMAVPKVTTPLGKIIGTRMVTRHGRNINAFLGIPYAQPPIGALRFKNPLPVNPWNDTFMANVEPSACPQIGENGTFFGVEDCLILNVYTPTVDKKSQLPTMVYIHGGAFQRGHTQTSSLGANYILDKDVVLVTLQYRLGALGFLSTGDAAAPGNFGLKDQALALQWVQDNIKSFGGDPNNVTLFGQSSGGASVNFHVLSKLSRGLFHRYIIQSAAALCPWTFAEIDSYKNLSFVLGSIFECRNETSEDLVNCLREIEYDRLVPLQNVVTGVFKLLSLSWMPTSEPASEGAFLTEHPLKTILGSKMQDLPNISGAVKDEGLVITTRLYANESLYNSLLTNITEFLMFMASPMVSKNDSNDLARNLQDFYFRDVESNDHVQVLSILTDLLSDISFLFPQVLQLQLVDQRTTSSCYFYSFEYRGTFSKTSEVLKNNDNVGVPHSDDIIYLFPSIPADFGFPNITMSDEDEKMIDILVDLWTNFAIYGIPITNFHKDRNLWKTYSHNNYHLRIGNGNKATLTGQNRFYDNRMHFWAIQALKLLIWYD